MTTRIADDFDHIKSRMEEIAKEREGAKVYIEAAKEVEPLEKTAGQPMMYMGWDIYAPWRPGALNDAARDYLATHGT